MKKQANTSKPWSGRFTQETNKLGEKNIENILHELKQELKRVYKNRLVSLILYGSYARGEAGADSDIDVVVLKGNVVPGREIDCMLDIITDLGLKYNTLISIYPVSENSMQSVKSPLLLNVHAEGISI
ncbi:MAG TPA: nucleotidyltransferase domain-containing protein [Deltaproteobacteria bacterium]|nr:nucleotidyltransferase domain-containing protein [Deltaproteobacteria bacterium]